MESNAKLIVLAEWENNGPWDSDFMAYVWDAAAGCVREALLGSTRWAGYEPARPATEGERAAARQWLAGVLVEAAAKAAQDAVENPTVRDLGRMVEVQLKRAYRPRAAGRMGADAGEVGTVVWSGRSPYGGERVGVAFPDGRRVFVALNNVRLTREPIDMTAAVARAVENERWGLAFGASRPSDPRWTY